MKVSQAVISLYVDEDGDTIIGLNVAEDGNVIIGLHVAEDGPAIIGLTVAEDKHHRPTPNATRRQESSSSRAPVDSGSISPPLGSADAAIRALARAIDPACRQASSGCSLTRIGIF